MNNPEEMKINNTKTIRIASWNVQSLIKKCDLVMENLHNRSFCPIVQFVYTISGFNL